MFIVDPYIQMYVLIVEMLNYECLLSIWCFKTVFEKQLFHIDLKRFSKGMLFASI